MGLARGRGPRRVLFAAPACCRRNDGGLDAMGLMDFIKKQFIDILEWTESGDGVLAWR